MESAKGEPVEEEVQEYSWYNPIGWFGGSSAQPAENVIEEEKAPEETAPTKTEVQKRRLLNNALSLDSDATDDETPKVSNPAENE